MTPPTRRLLIFAAVFLVLAVINVVRWRSIRASTTPLTARPVSVPLLGRPLAESERPAAKGPAAADDFRDPKLAPGSQDAERPPPTEALLNSFRSSDRDVSARPRDVIRLLGIRPADTVADIGAGSGYFTYHFSSAVGERGRVYATDVEPVALRYLRSCLAAAGVTNVSVVYGWKDDCALPETSTDVAFMCDVHVFAYPDAGYGFAQELKKVLRFYGTVRRALKPGGRLAIIEQTKESPDRNGLGGVNEDDIIRQLGKAGFTLIARHKLYKLQYFLVFSPTVDVQKGR